MGNDILDELEWRGLIAQSTDRDALAAELAKGPMTLYSGFDPTAGCGQAGDGRRGLLAVRPSEYAARLDALRRALGREPLPVGRGVCEPEHNVTVAASRLGRFYRRLTGERCFAPDQHG